MPPKINVFICQTSADAYNNICTYKNVTWLWLVTLSAVNPKQLAIAV